MSAAQLYAQSTEQARAPQNQAASAHVRARSARRSLERTENYALMIYQVIYVTSSSRNGVVVSQ